MSTAKPARRRPLSEERIVTAALRIADRHGLDALSMRRIGTALHCEAMSLYKHVADKDTLLELLVERVLGEMALPDPRAPWRQRIYAIADELRRVAIAHPSLLPLVATRIPANSSAALAPIDALLGALADAGLDDEASVSAFWAITAYATGALLAETAAITGTGTAQLVVDDEVEFVNLQRLGGALAACDFATEYRRGLTMLLTALTT